MNISDLIHLMSKPNINTYMASFFLSTLLKVAASNQISFYYLLKIIEYEKIQRAI